MKVCSTACHFLLESSMDEYTRTKEIDQYVNHICAK